MLTLFESVIKQFKRQVRNLPLVLTKLKNISTTYRFYLVFCLGGRLLPCRGLVAQGLRVAHILRVDSGAGALQRLGCGLNG